MSIFTSRTIKKDDKTLKKWYLFGIYFYQEEVGCVE